MSNDSSDSDDESQERKGKRAGASPGRSALGKGMNIYPILSLKMLMVISA